MACDFVISWYKSAIIVIILAYKLKVNIGRSRGQYRPPQEECWPSSWGFHAQTKLSLDNISDRIQNKKFFKGFENYIAGKPYWYEVRY